MIRKMKFSDMEQLIELMKRDGDHSLALVPILLYLNKSADFNHAYIAHVNQAVVGFVFGQIVMGGETLIPMYLYVAENFRGKKIGKRLMCRLEQKSGCTTSQIYYNASLHDYYAKQNYFAGTGLEVAIKMLNP